MRRNLVAVALALAATLGSRPSLAQPGPLAGVRVVVDVDGDAQLGGEDLGVQIRRELADAVGPLIPSRQLDEARAKLHLRGKKAAEAAAIAAAGREVGAEFVVRVKVQKKKKNVLSTRARLVDTKSGVVELDLKRKLKPKEDKLVGERIARQLVERLDQVVRTRHPIASAENAPVPASPPPLPVRAKEPDPQPFDPSDPTPPISEPKEQPRFTSELEAPPLSAEEERARFVAQKLAAREGRPSEGAEPNASAESNASANNLSSAPSASDAERPASSAMASVEPQRATAGVLRLAVSGGAGVLRGYSLSSAAVPRSQLSHELDPVGMLSGEAELVIPSVGAGVLLRAALRPIHYRIDTGGEVLAPSGMLFDASGAATYHLTLAGSGDMAIKLIPALGVRASLARVSVHTGTIIPSATALSVYGAAGLRYPINEVFELGAGVDFGKLISYAETPRNSGRSGAGLSLGAELSARIWVTNHLAIAFDNRFSLDSVSFEGEPTRSLPPAEIGRLDDASVLIRDLRSSVGVMVRF